MPLSTTEAFITSAVLLGGGGFVLLALAALIGRATARIEGVPDHPRVARTAVTLVAGVAVWFGYAVAVASSGPLDFAVVIPSALVPIALGTAITFIPSVAALLREIPVHWLIHLQFYRVIGFVFLVPYYSSGLLTRGFAFNAGIGDVLTGLLTIPVAILVARGGRRYTAVFLAWAAFSILDLIVAPASAAIFGFEAADLESDVSFPITLIPMFFGPPFGILLTIVSVRAFWLQHRARVEVPAPQTDRQPSPASRSIS